MNISGAAIGHPATRRGLRLRWLWAIAVAAAGVALIAPLLVLGVEAYPAMSAIALIAGTPLIILGISRLVGTMRVSRALHRHSWQRLTGRYYFRPPSFVGPHGSSADSDSVLMATAESGARIMLLVYSRNWAGVRTLRKLDHGEVWVAIGEKGSGVVAPPPGSRLFLAVHLRIGPKQESYYTKLFGQPLG